MFAMVLIVSNTIGALPLLIALVKKSVTNPGIYAQLAANPNDYSVLGLDPNVGLAMMLFPFIAGLIAFALLVKPLNNRTLKMTINGTGKLRWTHFFI